MKESRLLLAEYAQDRSESAFRELVSRYVDLVYSTALRLAGGDAHLAEDVSQTVFIQLARKAHRLSHDVMLGGWLHRATCNVAATALRAQRRRHLREKQAAEMNALQDHAEENLAQLAPVLDEAIDQLGAEERHAIVLRFFEQREFASVGTTLGISEDGARKRVERALVKLQCLLKRRGVTHSAVALGIVLSAQAVTAAPAGLATAIAGTALASSAAASASTLTLLKLMTLTKLKIGALGALLVAGVATPLVLQHQAQARLNERNEALERQAAQTDRLAAENQRLSNLLVQAGTTARFPDDTERELLRLRGEVGRLRLAAQELEQLKGTAALSEKDQVVQNALKWRDREVKLKALLQQMPNRTIPEFYLLSDRDMSDIARDADLDTDEGVRAAFFQLRHRAMNMFAPILQPALRKFTDAHDGQPPNEVKELAPYFDPPVDSTVLERYTVLYNTNSNHIMGGWTGGWVVTQKEPVDGNDSRWAISPVGFSAGQFDPPQPQH